MGANHKTFTGGYKFNNFEGQPSQGLILFNPVSDVNEVTIKSGQGVTAADVLEALQRTNLSGPQSALISTHGKIEPFKVKDIIVNMVEVEPYNLPSRNLLSVGNNAKFMFGLKDIHNSYSDAKITLVVGENQIGLLKLLTQNTDKLSWLDLVTVVNKYPSNLKEMAIPLVLHKKYPVGYDPAHIAVVHLGIKDVLHVASVVSEKKTISSTAVALSGPGWKKNLVLDIPVGTKVKDLAQRYVAEGEMRFIKNSILTGEQLALEDVVTFDTDLIIAVPEDRRRQTLTFLRSGKKADSFTNTFISKLLPKSEKSVGTNLQGERRACVSCSYCESVCPVGLIPHLLHKHGDKNIINKRLAEYKIFDCIECGLCNYVCLSKIEVLSNIKGAKEALEKSEISHNTYVIPQCDMVIDRKEVASGE